MPDTSISFFIFLSSRRARSGPPPHSPIALSDVHKEAKSPNASKKVKRNIAPALIAEVRKISAKCISEQSY